ncbi:MAG TPA: COX15/CtaA family protein [Blastocatellia bacterium]|nr:COX15/CtaA family protein [Blastocatellia bacterium]
MIRAKLSKLLKWRPQLSNGLHYIALLTVCATFVLIIAGALVTSNGAGDSVPDWPMSFGRWLITSDHFIANVRFEYSHRVIAGSVGMLTLILAVFAWLRESRVWVKRLALAVFGLVIAQAVIGGIRVHYPGYKAEIAIPHALVAQSFLALIVSLVVFTSRKWFEPIGSISDKPALSLRSLSAVTTIAILVQLVLGAGFRHQAFGILPHVFGAVVVGFLVFLTATLTLTRHKESYLQRPAMAVIGLVVVQIGLGIASYYARLASINDPQPLEPMVSLTVAHVATGALTLTAMVVLTLRIYRVLSPAKATVELASREATV